MARAKTTKPRSRSDTGEAWLTGGGEMGSLIRQHDWGTTPLGPVKTWPQSLRSAVSILLPSRAQIVLFWGPELISIYNDAYTPVFGAKHPWALGRPARECWSEVWHVIGPLFEGVVRTGKAFGAKEHPFHLQRQGFLEETYFDVSYDPVRVEDGSVGGVFCIVNEQTGRVLGERRLRMLRELGARTADAKGAEEVCREAAVALAMDPADVPFSLLYLTDGPGLRAELIGVGGVDLADVPCGREVGIGDVGALTSAREGQAAEVEAGVFVRRVPEAAAPRVLVLPISSGTQIVGALVAGVSRHLPLIGDYRDFFDLAAARVSAAIAKARAYEAEQKRAETLAELDRAKTTFFSNVSHEFRTPLTLLLGPIEDALADQTRVLPVEDAARLDLAHRNGLRLLKLVNTLLDFSRIEAGRTQAIYEPVDLAVYTAELASVFRTAVERAGLRLTVDCPPLSEPVCVDRDMWEKIVLNLLSNAFKYTFAGEIQVSLRAEQGSAVLTVRDSGTGIPEAELPNLFNRFHRITGARGRTQEGTGIGLALVSELAKLHGGSVAVESVWEQGSTFVVAVPFGQEHLPLDQIGDTRALAPTALRASPFVAEALRWLPGVADADHETLPLPERKALDGLPPVAGNGPKARIVWADDNADMREYVQRLLLARDYQVIAVTDGQEALSATLEHSPDLVLTDVMMPNLDGFGLLQAIRADTRTASTPVIMLSARAGEDARVEGLQAVADDYLIKPFTARELLARVGATLAAASIRRQAVEALRESEARFRNMADNAPVMIWMTDPSASCLYLSRLWYEFTGQTPETGLGSGWTKAVYPGDRDSSGETFLRANEKREAFSLEYRLRRHDGEYRWAIAAAAPWFDTEGHFQGYIGSVIDITERREAEERLRQSAKMEAIGRLAGGIAHDFNNQLHAILGFAEFVARDAGLGARARQDLSEIQKVAERMTSLTNQLLAYSRQQILMPETLDLNDAVRDSQVMLQRLIGSDIQMQLRLSPEPIWTRADRGQLLQVLMNLAINARDAMPDGGELALDTAHREVKAGDLDAIAGTSVAPGRYATLVVADSGSGIAPEYLTHLFEPFFTTKEIGKGTGLGLATVQGIVMQSQGYVWAENAPGAGATFTVLLPLAGEPALTASGTARRSGATLRHARLLLVEDEDVLRGMLARTLEDQGHEVLQARHGGEALHRLQEVDGAVDLVISDVVMPVMGGRALGERLAAEYPDLPLIWMSGYPRDAAFGSGVSREDQPFLQKPVPGDVLVETVRQVLESRVAAGTTCERASMSGSP